MWTCLAVSQRCPVRRRDADYYGAISYYIDFIYSSAAQKYISHLYQRKPLTLEKPFVLGNRPRILGLCDRIFSLLRVLRSSLPS